jgi:regulator of replication initiation timing
MVTGRAAHATADRMAELANSIDSETKRLQSECTELKSRLGAVMNENAELEVWKKENREKQRQMYVSSAGSSSTVIPTTIPSRNNPSHVTWIDGAEQGGLYVGHNSGTISGLRFGAGPKK